jgi:MFS transporter, MHS family, citrate/tricarballylate:H+ symporter
VDVPPYVAEQLAPSYGVGGATHEAMQQVEDARRERDGAPGVANLVHTNIELEVSRPQDHSLHGTSRASGRRQRHPPKKGVRGFFRVTTTLLLSVTAVEDAALSPQHLPLKKVFAVAIGNALEFYDFLTFSFFAVQIGRAFFPAASTSHGLLYSLATFGVGFVTRPLGGVVIGSFADRRGRKPAMMLSFSLMGVAIVGLALTPSYAQIGPAAPVMLVVFRLAQGFALGGEVGPSTAFLVEAAPPHRRGLYVALQYMTQDCAILAAGLAGFGLSSWLSPAALDAWGWRLAFLLGAAVVPVGLVIRRSLPETLNQGDETPGAGASPRAPKRLIALGIVMLSSTTIVFYVTDYLATYAQDCLHMTASQGFVAVVVVGAFGVMGDPICGLLSDRIGRKPVMLGGAMLLVLLTVPAFLLMTRAPGIASLYASAAVLGFLATMAAAPALITITESMPKRVRAGTLGTVYAVALASFGGTTQFAVKWLTDATGSRLAPAWYMTCAIAIGAVAMALTEESAPVKTGRAS